MKPDTDGDSVPSEGYNQEESVCTQAARQDPTDALIVTFHDRRLLLLYHSIVFLKNTPDTQHTTTATCSLASEAVASTSLFRRTFLLQPTNFVSRT
jgi:hypothetical protein